MSSFDFALGSIPRKCPKNSSKIELAYVLVRDLECRDRLSARVRSSNSSSFKSKKRFSPRPFTARRKHAYFSLPTPCKRSTATTTKPYIVPDSSRMNVSCPDASWINFGSRSPNGRNAFSNGGKITGVYSSERETSVNGDQPTSSMSLESRAYWST